MFRFTIRDLLWLTVVVALGAGWWIERSRLVRIHEQEIQAEREEVALLLYRASEMADQLAHLGWTVKFDEAPDGLLKMTPPNSSADSPNLPSD